MEKVIIVLEKEPVYIDGVLHFKRILKKNGIEIYSDTVTQERITKIATKALIYNAIRFTA